MVLRAVASLTHETMSDEPECRVASSASPYPVPPPVLQAISSMQARYFEPITLTDLASEVFVSPFHFSRVFARATGVTPGRFLTAVRLFEAKRLLLTTSLTVSDIVCSVGYSSVGTFTSRFTQAVGMTPTQYRDPEVGEVLVAVAPHFQRLPSLHTLRDTGYNCSSLRVGTGVITARIEMPKGAAPADVLVGVFADDIPQSSPVAFGGMAGAGSGEVTIPGVPEGEWTVLAVAAHAPGTPGTTFSVGTLASRVTVGCHGRVRATFAMREPRPIEPPFAVTLAERPTPLAGRSGLPRRPYLRAVA
ncbi:helix-turn-helix transcriptional regulator [Amycolatopsis sp. NPDC059027]|uniref:helix-turn-helix transcriptional regulator n=1 Tax=unclassified Amycolatopsis TaxID=2618356 RepID=UPI0036701925